VGQTLIAGLGIVMTLFPDRVVDGYERRAVENRKAAVDKLWAELTG